MRPPRIALSGSAVTVRRTVELPGGIMSASDVHTLLAYIDDALPSERVHWPSGWPGEIEAALLDAVFSARATYGTPTSGVRRVVANWRAHRGGDLDDLDDLTAVAAFVDTSDRLAEILGNRQRVPGNYTTKAEAAALAAAALVEAGVAGSARIGDGRIAREALASVPGLGATTWETFVLQLGLVGPVALDTIRQFVTEAMGPGGTPVTETRALEVLADATEHLDVDPTALLGAVWRYGRSRDRTRNPLSA